MFFKIIWVLVVIVLWGAPPLAQDVVVPVDVQFPLFLKILTFDRHFKTRVRDEIVIGILYQKKFRASLNVKNAFLNAVDESSIKTIEGLPIRCVPIEIEDDTLESALSQNRVNLLYVAPVRAVNVEDITFVSRAKQVVTFTGVPDYVELGLAVGIGAKGERPLIIINLPAAKAEGADFRSQLLRLAKVIQ
jgi:hypothetical protein